MAKSQIVINKRVDFMIQSKKITVKGLALTAGLMVASAAAMSSNAEAGIPRAKTLSLFLCAQEITPSG